MDSAGDAYVTGSTASTDLPTTPGALDRGCGTEGACNVVSDAFVAKLNPSGSALIYSTYLGGSGSEDYFTTSGGIAVDSSGNAYIEGITGSNDFPTKDPLQTVGGNGDSFVTILNTTGSALLFSTYLGGSNSDVASDIALDAVGNIYVTGGTSSTDFPVTLGAFQTTFRHDSDAFVVKIANKTPDSTPPAISNKSASPNPFSPNSDGIKDTTAISFDINEDSSFPIAWKVEVFPKSTSCTGSAVRTFTGSLAVNGTVNLTWDGKNTTNIVVPDGTYCLRITATDATDNSATSDPDILVDTTPPSLSLNPASGRYITNALNFTWQAADTLSGLNSVSIKINGIEVSTSASGQLGLAPGTYAVTGAAIDQAGNPVSDSRAYNVVLPVKIDIKPGSDPNTINCKNQNVIIPVAVLSDPSFDATRIALSTVNFAGATHEIHGKLHLEDANRDGLPDVVLHFRFAETQIKCGDTQAKLTAKTVDGVEIEGGDSIRTVQNSVNMSTLRQEPNAIHFILEDQEIKSLRLQVLALSGQRIYDSGFVVGNSLRWNLLNSQGKQIANGGYLYVVTVRGFDGKVIRSELRKLVILR